jgi:hypothetical protein
LRFFELLRFFEGLRFLEDFLEELLEAFFGTFLPLALASDNPIAIACLRLLTLRPERPLFKVPALRFFIARLTSFDELLEYFRAMNLFSRLRENNPCRHGWFRLRIPQIALWRSENRRIEFNRILRSP